MTSSKIRSVRLSSVLLRTTSRQPSTGGTTPMLPATGSMITAAMSSPNWLKASFRLSSSLYGTVIVLAAVPSGTRSEEHTSELQSRFDLVCRLLLEKKKIYHESLLH